MSNKTKIYGQYLFFSMLIVLSSLFRWYSTGTLKADGNFVNYSKLHTWILFLSYVLGFLGLVYTYTKIVFNHSQYQLNQIQVRNLAFLSCCFFFFMTVIFASDIYTYLAEGDLASRGIFTYTNGEILKQSLFIDYVSDWWKECPNHYGPPLLFLFYLSVLIGKTIMGSYVVFKLLMLFTTIASIHLVYKFFVNSNKEYKYNMFAFVALAPIILIEGAGQAHVEIFIALLLAGCIYQFLKENYINAIGLIALAMSCKIMYSMILFPFIVALFYVEFINKEKSILKFSKYLVYSFFITIVVIAISYIPVWESIQTILAPMDYHKTKTPSRSFTEVFILIYHYGRELVSTNFSISGLIEKTHESNFLTKTLVLNYQSKVAPIFKIVGILLAGFSIIPLLKTKNITFVFHVFAKVWIIIITFYSPIFNPWYYIPILILLYNSDKKSWIVYSIIAMSFTINPQLSNSIPPGHIAEVILSINLLCFPIIFLIYFQENFIMETYRNI